MEWKKICPHLLEYLLEFAHNSQHIPSDSSTRRSRREQGPLRASVPITTDLPKYVVTGAMEVLFIGGGLKKNRAEVIVMQLRISAKSPFLPHQAAYDERGDDQKWHIPGVKKRAPDSSHAYYALHRTGAGQNTEDKELIPLNALRKSVVPVPMASIPHKHNQHPHGDHIGPRIMCLGHDPHEPTRDTCANRITNGLDAIIGLLGHLGFQEASSRNQPVSKRHTRCIESGQRKLQVPPSRVPNLVKN